MHSHRKTFHHLLINTLLANITNFFVWFALTFWVYLTTKSIVATSVIAGVYATMNTISAFLFGSIVDHHRKKQVMLASSGISLGVYAIGTILYFSAPPGTFTSATSFYLIGLSILLLLGTIIGSLRTISLSTCVTLLISPEEHAKANGKIGMVSGVAFSITSILSGLAIGYRGMGRSLVGAIVCSILVILHLLTISLPEKDIVHTHDAPKKVDVRGTIAVISSIPGMFALIFFTTFNNFLGGAFMALMDAYGLSLVSVQTWGIILASLSSGFIVSGLLISKFGLGKNPLTTLFKINVITWTTCIFFVIQPWVWLLVLGMFIWMVCSPVIEATESTVIQKVVPYERQGRVFGFAQSIESAASPLTAFLIGPITQYVFIPWISNGGYGAQLIGEWFGTGPARGIALVFIVAGMLGLIMTLLSFNSKYYRILSDSYLKKE